MSFILNDAAAFADESAAGFVTAHAHAVRRVPGGVARRSATPDGQVAVVIGGGSGHYPAFAGLVGPGLAHAAAMGNIFASPSSQQVHSVARSVAGAAGVLLSYGNYAGDVLNFDLAQERLIAEGVPTRTVTVTDDIYSASVEERHKRRGIAGDLAVFKAAAWAAEQGRDLDAVAAFAAHANDRTRSVGVAFTGCTLPGAAEPLFTVPEGQMAVGMGIHGEPGIEMRPIPTAHELGGFLVDALLAELPDDIASADGARVGVILNGLGSIKSEELFLLYGEVAPLLSTAGITVVDPEIGEYATSFEMAGISLTILWLDDELEQAWLAGAQAPGYRKGSASAGSVTAQAVADGPSVAAATEIVPAGSDSGRHAGIIAADAIHRIREVIDREVDELGRLDAIAGDGDHGIGMQRGAHAADEAAMKAIASDAGAGTVLALAGDAWADRAGGTSGALWGAGLRAAGAALGDDDIPDAARLGRAMDAARDTVQRAGKAEVGDKTLVDALVPFAETLAAQAAAGARTADAWQAAVHAAQTAADATADLLPRMGRARPHMQKSLGTPDPGAVSFAMAMDAVLHGIRAVEK